MKQFFHDLTIIVAMLVLALIASAFLGGPMLDCFMLFLDDDQGQGVLFGKHLAISLSLTLPMVIFAWAFRGRFLPDSFLKCDLPAITGAAFLDLLIVYGLSLLNDSSPSVLQMEQICSTLTAWAIAMVLALLTNERGRFIMMASAKVILFGLTAPFFLLSAVLLWPIFPSGKHFFYICRRLWAPFVMWFCGVKFKNEGLEKLDFSKPAILVPTHSSILDIVALVQNVPQELPMLAKKSIYYVPLFGQLAALAGYVFIDRRNGKVALDKLEKSLGRIVKRRQWLAIFAEGTRTPEGQIHQLKKGAFLMAIKKGLPVVPVAIIGAGEVLPIGTCLVRPGTITLRFGSPISSEGLVADDWPKLQQQTQQALADLSGWAIVPDSKN